MTTLERQANREITAPLSFTGSARRIHTMLPNPWAWGTLGMLLVMFAWLFIFCWYCIFGLFLAPYRIVRRGSRKRKKADAQHRQLLNAVAAQQATASVPASAPGGWYADPHGQARLRWFDGQQWTEHTSA